MKSEAGLLVIGTAARDTGSMAENSAATATANAGATASPPSGGLAMSNDSTSGASSELLSSDSFDVEEFLAGGDEEEAATEKENEGEDNKDDGSTDEGDADNSEGVEEEGDEEGDEADSETDAELLKALKPKAVKRFNQMLKQRDEALADKRAAEADRDALKKQIEDGQDVPTPLSIASDPLAKLTTPEQLEAHGDFFRQVRSWCRRNPSGGSPPKELTGGVETDLTAEQVVSNLEHAESILEALPKRAEFLTKFKAERSKAREAYPNVFKAGTPENTVAKSLLPKLLNFATQADQDTILAKLAKVELMESEEREGVARYTRVELKPGKGKTTAEAPAKPSPRPAAPNKTGTQVLRPSTAKTGQEAVWDKLNAPGGSVDVEDLMGA